MRCWSIILHFQNEQINCCIKNRIDLRLPFYYGGAGSGPETADTRLDATGSRHRKFGAQQRAESRRKQNGGRCSRCAGGEKQPATGGGHLRAVSPCSRTQ